jgi:hypothetical protein
MSLTFMVLLHNEHNAMHRLTSLGIIGPFDSALDRLPHQEFSGQAESRKLVKITEKDLLEEIRLNGKITSVEQAQTAVLERNGTIKTLASRDPDKVRRRRRPKLSEFGAPLSRKGSRHYGLEIL